MSEDREQAGSPVEQTEATETQVLAAVERAAEVAPAGTDPEADSAALPADTAVTSEPGSPATETASERPTIVAATDPPNAGKLETAEEIFAAHTPHSTTRAQDADPVPAAEPVVAVSAPAATSTEAVAAAIAASETELPPVRDGEIRISSDHPMAALYMQSPMPPELRGNRGAGVLIALLSTVGFALVFAGVLALWLAPNFPPSTFLNAGLLPWIMNWGFAAAAAGFFIGLTLLVLIVGRAGWWAYVLGGLLVAILTWAVAVLGFALNDRLAGETVSLNPISLLTDYGLFFPAIAAGLVAREVSVWFGAWIGARGRRMKRLNAAAITEYETSLAEAQAKQP